MSRPEGLRGPTTAGAGQIDRINRIFSEAFTDRYQRDGMNGVRVPFLNPAIWRFAIADAADGAMVWHDASGAIVAFNMVHRSGTEGWMGPLAVRPDRQGEGIGALIVRAGMKWLQRQGALTIGLETMPRTIENIGFYSRLGFRPGHLTVSMTRDLDGPGRGSGTRLSGQSLEDGLRRCGALVESLAPGVDFSREIVLTLEHGLGDVTLLAERGGLAGFALWHAAPLAEGRSGEEVRVLKLAAKDPASFLRVVEAVEADAWTARARRVGIRCQTVYREPYGLLLDAQYRVHWTDLRMTLDGKGEAPAANGGVVFSNWEI